MGSGCSVEVRHRFDVHLVSIQPLHGEKLTMSIASDDKQARINIRLKAQTKALLERAASFEGKTVSNFIVTSAMAQAEKTVQSHEVMDLAAQDAHALFEALNKPVRFNNKLLAAFKEHDQRVTEQ